MGQLTAVSSPERGWENILDWKSRRDKIKIEDWDTPEAKRRCLLPTTLELTGENFGDSSSTVFVSLHGTVRTGRYPTKDPDYCKNNMCVGDATEFTVFNKSLGSAKIPSSKHLGAQNVTLQHFASSTRTSAWFCEGQWVTERASL